MQIKKISIFFGVLFFLHSLICFGKDAELKKDLIATRKLASRIIQWSLEGKVDELWAVSSKEKINELIKQFGSELKAKEALQKQYSKIKIHHWKIVKENYEKIHDSMMITLDVFLKEDDKKPQKKQLVFIRELGLWKWRY